MNAFVALQRALIALILAACALLPVSIAFGDPLPGRDVLKFRQRPMDGTPIVNDAGGTTLYWGHDELSTAYSSAAATAPRIYQGVFMADDFADKFSSPVVHVKWWGSYLNNFQTPEYPVDKFLISFESDIPQSPNNPFSRPGEPLLNQIVRRVPAGGGLTPGSGTFTEKPISPGGPPLSEALYEYNAELHLGKEFYQKPDTVYWLKIVALVDLPAGVPIEPPPTFAPRWGWHNRDYTIFDPLASTAPAVVPGEFLSGTIGAGPAAAPIWHFQDDAVTGRIFVDTAGPMGQIMPVIDQSQYAPTHYQPLADGPEQIVQYSKDLAFELYTLVPEPASCLMLLASTAAIALVSRRRE
jgi:hypothetical protein